MINKILFLILSFNFCCLLYLPAHSYSPLSKKYPKQLNYFLKDARKDFEKASDPSINELVTNEIDQDWRGSNALDTEEGLYSILYLDDGSIISGYIQNTDQDETYLVKTSFAEIKIHASKILKVLNNKESKYITELRNCRKNQKQIKDALKNYYQKYGKKGIKRLNSWSKESKYLLILQVEHAFERIPQCAEKSAQYKLIDPREGSTECTIHGNIDEITKKIRKILFHKKEDN